MHKWQSACVALTGSSNVYRENGSQYFWEVSNREHGDGAITGAVYQSIETRADGSGTCRKVGSFRIGPDGTVKRAPKFLRDATRAVVESLPVNAGIGSGG